MNSLVTSIWQDCPSLVFEYISEVTLSVGLSIRLSYEPKAFPWLTGWGGVSSVVFVNPAAARLVVRHGKNPARPNCLPCGCQATWRTNWRTEGDLLVTVLNSANRCLLGQTLAPNRKSTRCLVMQFPVHPFAMIIGFKVWTAIHGIELAKFIFSSSISVHSLVN